MKCLFCLRAIGLLLALTAIGAQTVPNAKHGSTATPEPPKQLSDVKHGMPRDLVLSGLGGHYKLSGSENGSLWGVTGKDSDESGLVFFQDGRVASVVKELTPGYGGDAVTFSQELFKALYLHAKRAEAFGDKTASPVDTKQTIAVVELAQLNPLVDLQRITLRLSDGTQFNISISKSEKSGIRTVALESVW